MEYYQRALRINPNNTNALNNLGVALAGLGQVAAATDCYRQILRINPEHAEAHNNLGLVYDGQGQLAEAIKCYQQALRLSPDHAEAFNNLGSAYFGQRQFEEAIRCYRQALERQPQHPGALNNLGFALYKQGRLDAAIACYHQALRINPNHADAHSNLGSALATQGDAAGAVECYRRALKINPDHADAHYNLGIALKVLGRIVEAIACLRQALHVNPNLENAHYNLGNALHERGQPDQAIECYRQVLRLNPNHSGAHNDLGAALIGQGELAQATKCFREALRHEPEYANALNNLGNALVWHGELEEAAECYRRALRIDPGHRMAVWNRSFLRLLQGDFEGGWPDYELRRARPGVVPRTFKQPRWDGSPLDGKTILLYAEQGLGDTIQFIRYAEMVQAHGGRVLFECPPPLLRLFEGVAGIDQLVPQGPTDGGYIKTALPPFDVQIPLLSLPGIFQTTLSNIPTKVPYLRADPLLVEHWRKELHNTVSPLAPHSSPLKIGIVWQGNPRFAQPDCRVADQTRSIALGHFELLARLPGVRLFSLQKGFGTEQLDQYGAAWNIVDLGDRLTDLMDTAALMMNLDLIISADTAPLHLAGALGRPVWAALPLTGCWRWLQGRDDSPWYPTMRLFRQSRMGDWHGVFERMAADVHEKLK